MTTQEIKSRLQDIIKQESEFGSQPQAIASFEGRVKQSFQCQKKDDTGVRCETQCDKCKYD